MIIGNSYRQKFNHIHPGGATFFITFRLHGSIPKSTLAILKEKYESEIIDAKSITSSKQRNTAIFNLRKQYLVEFDNVMDGIKSGPHYLSKTKVLNIIKEQLHRHDESLYNLICYSVMSNHVHMLIDTSINLTEDTSAEKIHSTYTPLYDIMKSIKGTSA